MTTTEDAVDDRDTEIRNLLKEIRDLALSPYPFPGGTIVRPEYALALGQIAGIATRAWEIGENKQ